MYFILAITEKNLALEPTAGKWAPGTSGCPIPRFTGRRVQYANSAMALADLGRQTRPCLAAHAD
jgi:hypothetical protein